VAITPVTVTGSGGVAPYSFSATGLPTGISISSTGTISGTPTESGTFNYAVTVTDSVGKTGTVNCSVTVVPPCNIIGACTPPYPFASTAYPLTSVVFNESGCLVSNLLSADANCSPTEVQVFYNDEHAMTLGVRQVVLKTTGGTTVNNYTVTPLTSDPEGFLNPQVGATVAEGGVDVSTRPMFPAMFVTDITLNPSNPDAGDWQYGGVAQPPTAVFGTWKAAVATVDQTKTPPVITVTPDSDPAQNNWNLGAGSDPVPAGLTSPGPGPGPAGPANQGYSTEVRWAVSSLVDNFGLPLKSGHTYRLYFMLHDGDQNKVGGDCGQACGVITIP
jgi:hypothetical protein